MNKFYMAAAGVFGAALMFPLAANAAPLGASGLALEQARAEQSNIIQVQQRVRGGRNYQRGPRAGVRGPAVRSPRIVQRGGYAYYGGHRGYRYARPGYRHYNGFWFPPAAFAAGAILGGALAGGAVYAAPVGLSPQHYAWCQQRYISYRAADNSFQPYNGPRQACISPYS
jgi:hypothetical protein